MNTLYVHVGLHKTGSTSIQYCLTSLRDRLRAEGILYPASCLSSVSDVAHHDLAWTFLTRPDAFPPGKSECSSEAEKSKIVDQLGLEARKYGSSTVIVSSEEFSRLSADEIKEFCHAFHDYAIHPVFFVRNSADIYESSYITCILHYGFTYPIDVYIEHSGLRLDLYEMISEWRRNANVTSATIVDYEKSRDKMNSPRLFFDCVAPNIGSLEPVSVESDKLLDETRLNTGVPVYIAELVRTMRVYGCGSKYIEEFLTRARANIALAEKGQRYSFLSDNQYNWLTENYCNEVRKVNANLDMNCRLSEPRRRNAGVFTLVSNSADALLALSETLPRLATPGWNS